MSHILLFLDLNILILVGDDTKKTACMMKSQPDLLIFGGPGSLSSCLLSKAIKIKHTELHV
jgi:hypothetical protein